MIEILAQRIELGNLVVKCKMASPTGPIIVFVTIQPNAIGNRMHFYALATEDEAIDAILREHYHRLHGKEQSPPSAGSVTVGGIEIAVLGHWEDVEPAERGRITGGLDDKVKIKRK